MIRTSLLLVAAILLGGCTKAEATRGDSPSQQSPTAISVDPVSPTDSIADADSPLPKAATPLTFAFTGDIMMGTTYPDEPAGAYLPPQDGAVLFQDVAGILSSADFAAGNLEGTLLDSEGVVKKCGNPELCYAFRMPTRYTKHLTGAGYDFVSVANNHINDFGAPGLSSTLNALEEAGLRYAGLRASCPTSIIEKDGRKIGFAAFGHNKGTLSIMNMEEVRRTVGGLAKECDIVVVSFHGGGEGSKYTHVPHAMETCFGEQRGNVEAFAHAAIDAGADVVYGHGPHVTRALELYRDRLIMYSLGNFCTPYRMNLKGINGHAPVVTVTLNADGSFSAGKIHSFIQSSGTGPRIDATHSVARNMKALTASDFPNSPLKIADDGVLSRK